MIHLQNVCKRYEGHGLRHEVLRDVSISFQRGDAVGILGRNGAGKSTLLRLIAGVLPPSSGRIDRQMSVSWPLGYSGAMHTSLTGADNARFIARIYGKDCEEVLDFVQAFAELGKHFTLPVRTYSSGMMMRLAFALSFAIDFDCYLIDEATAAGDARFTERCRRALLERRHRSTLLLVSHIPETVRGYCTSAAVLHEGRLARYEHIDDAIAAYHTH